MRGDADAQTAHSRFQHEIKMLETLAVAEVDCGAAGTRPVGPRLCARFSQQQSVAPQLRQTQALAVLEQRGRTYRPNPVGEERGADHIAWPRRPADSNGD